MLRYGLVLNVRNRTQGSNTFTKGIRGVKDLETCANNVDVVGVIPYIENDTMTI